MKRRSVVLTILYMKLEKDRTKKGKKEEIALKKITAFILSAVTASLCIAGIPAVSADAADNSNVLVAYFSCTGNTESIANHIKDILGCDICKIEAAVPYTSADLNYNNSSSRATVEQNTPSARPAVSGTINTDKYDTIFLGYPIWWGQAPKIIYTFLESHDLSGKTIIPFCTSGSSDISGSESGIHALATDATWISGHRFAAGSSEATVSAWVDTIKLPEPTSAPQIEINDGTVTVNNAPENSALIAASYKSDRLVSVKVINGSGTISTEIADISAGADKIKAFLWNMAAMSSYIIPLEKSIA